MEPMISFKNFSFRYRSLSEPTLKKINLDIFKGEKILIAGPSGSGKSTLAHCINGLIPFSYEGEIQGELTICGFRPSDKSIFAISQTVGTILQDQDAQFVGLSVGEDVAFVAENEMTPQEIMHTEVARALAMVDMEAYIRKSPHELSGGQKQRVSLAGLLATQAEVLLFDEPLANLDPASGKKAMELITEIHQRTGKTIIIIEHRIEDVLEQPFDKVVLIDRGEIQAYGTPDEILASDHLRKSGLREPLYIEALKYARCELLPADGLSQLHHLNQPKFKEALIRWYHAHQQKTTKVERPRVLALEKVHFSYDRKEEVIRGVSLEVCAGEVVAILGNNGAGKSTLSHLITGIQRPTSGTMYFQDEPMHNWSIRKRGQRIGYVMQNPNLMITQHMIKEEVGFGLVNQGVEPGEIERRVEETLKTCGLYAYRNWPVTALSYGQKKRLTIASILVMEPQIIILDEPTAGQDYKHYTDFMDFIRTIADRGIAVILITHDMHLALEYADRAIVISEGRKIADDVVANILTNPEIIHQANLKETSLSKLAHMLELETPEGFVQHFIDYEKRVKRHE